MVRTGRLCAVPFVVEQTELRYRSFLVYQRHYADCTSIGIRMFAQNGLVLSTALDERDIGSRSPFKPIDATASGGNLVSHILRALVELDNELIRERTRASALLLGSSRSPVHRVLT